MPVQQNYELAGNSLFVKLQTAALSHRLCLFMSLSGALFIFVADVDMLLYDSEFRTAVPVERS